MNPNDNGDDTNKVPGAPVGQPGAGQGQVNPGQDTDVAEGDNAGDEEETGDDMGQGGMPRPATEPGMGGERPATNPMADPAGMGPVNNGEDMDDDDDTTADDGDDDSDGDDDDDGGTPG